MHIQKIIVCFLTWLTLATSSVHADEPATPKNGGNLTLLGMLSDWQYPEAKFGGAQMSDAAVTGVSSVKCRARLTTPDSPDKVIAWYLGELKVDTEGNPLGAAEGERKMTDRAVVIQDDSENRDLALTVLHIHDQRSSTTLTISRSKQEQTTHIGWTHYRRVWPE